MAANRQSSPMMAARLESEWRSHPVPVTSPKSSPVSILSPVLTPVLVYGPKLHPVPMFVPETSPFLEYGPGTTPSQSANPYHPSSPFGPSYLREIPPDLPIHVEHRQDVAPDPDPQSATSPATNSGQASLRLDRRRAALQTQRCSCPSSGMMKGIIPKNKTKGTDFCGVKDYYYIIRSDLGCYMQSSNFNKGTDLTIFSLHPTCQNGDHYLGHQDGYFYIIKGHSYRRVTDLSTDGGAVVYSLHPNCQGGDHYLSAFGKFYIIFQGKGTYRRTTNMNQDSDAVEYDLHPNCRDGLYYWGLPNHYYFLKPVSEWGVEYYKATNFNKGSVSVSILFIPMLLTSCLVACQ
ncbi:hypothetical protein G5714_010578 [Onychostoma macrolepis]|uniref:Uncharacterized protein n=1 Tax=Onychostoma macrolepis TaxID=369639 RepID=A0A7J6CSA2_9TELE|nr:hypothetical protein G5714_010578 [Onychostoma macrolepis]